MKKVALYSLLILLIQINCMAIAQNHSHTDILLPDNTIEGFLPNGLHYIILPNENPKNIVEMRLVMDLGSNLEKHDEKGVAHYLEHVAFIGTKNFPDRSMVEFWEKYGMKFGKDINAYTGYDRTIYMVTLPTTEKNDKIIDTSLFALKDWLCNISFKKERTNREKGIILEELNGYTIDDEFHDLKIGTNEFSNHFPLSNSKNISEVTYKKLTSFYKKWYAPQLATIVVVGDIDAKAVEVKIQDLFSNIKQKR
jgi:Predicted Zn-dependent peptidases